MVSHFLRDLPGLFHNPVDPASGVPQFAVPFNGEEPIILGVHLGDGFNPDDPTDPRTGLDGITQFAGRYNDCVLPQMETPQVLWTTSMLRVMEQ